MFVIPLSQPFPTKLPEGYLNVMGYVDRSEVNGPGCRAVVWVQGCWRSCQGCFNPASWKFEINQLLSIEEVAARILSQPKNQGVTFSGGEPFLQAEALARLAKLVKREGLNVMSFTGFTLTELRSPQAPKGAQDLLEQLDILIDGPFVESLAVNSPNSPVSSYNQKVHIFNPEFKDRIDWASNETEVHILKDGSYLVTGYRGQVDFLAN